ncbi:helix-loop-helix DNA-binding domain protein [Metarhizium robertsii]|uniref:Helix-loop-helix DNA-binding domain protein n=2 Tax=Metarhizium robertsii TaxID=568076 RepID=E9ETS4_METRA|nr:Helix-loop-helix DNA-binding domain protein [Metarhizium robertsii ARSEF 23]EFZ00827.1 Helix-loop-helix DNA-binding domain protein [Metarhizium robertsii ARSEF 23]EXV03351.1 helix-loop-helix DNA-binding domain protein [Metarhizium robertsii]
MSDSVATEQADLSSLTSSPGSKRKRELDSPGSQRAKRAAPPAAMTAETAAFIENAIEATHAAAANGVNVADFNALQQAAAADHTDASDPSNATSTAQAALGMYPTLHVPPSTEEQFAAQAAAEGDHHSEAAFNAEIAQPDMMDPSAVTQQPPANGSQPPAHRYSTSSAPSNPKPTVGSEEWHKMRKDNHKEVERRRRETINEGINELAKIVPGCEKNKGSILQRAVSFISQLKENEQQNIEKWTLEKLLTEQAITELSASNDKLKQECERLYRELETWKRVAQNAGLEPPQPKEEPNTGASSS